MYISMQTISELMDPTSQNLDDQILAVNLSRCSHSHSPVNKKKCSITFNTLTTNLPFIITENCLQSGWTVVLSIRILILKFFWNQVGIIYTIHRWIGWEIVSWLHRYRKYSTTSALFRLCKYQISMKREHTGTIWDGVSHPLFPNVTAFKFLSWFVGH